jgi:hypothetical protein|tara:strand:+ start:56 stop:421 length:366 start_codon:yes stop_codon:yes gene_type:complete
MSKSKGLGDDIKKIADKTGISKAVKMIFGDDCGCEERRQKLNNMFPNFKNIRPFTKDEKKVYEKIIPEVEKIKKVSSENQVALNVLYKAVFNTPAKWSNCGSCNIKTLENLRRVYEKSCDL